MRGKFVNIGSQKERWYKVKTEKGLKSDEELCRLLINSFYQFEKYGHNMSTLHRQRKMKFRNTRIFCLPDKTWKQWLDLKSSLGMSSNHEVADMLIDLWYKHVDQKKRLHKSNKTLQSKIGPKDDYDSSANYRDGFDQQAEVKVERDDEVENDDIGSYRTVKVEQPDDWQIDKDVSENKHGSRSLKEQSSYLKNDRVSKQDRRGARVCRRPNYARMTLDDESDDDDVEQIVNRIEHSVPHEEIKRNSDASVRNCTQLKTKEDIDNKNCDETVFLNILNKKGATIKKQRKKKDKANKEEDPNFVVSGEEIESLSKNTDDRNSDCDEYVEPDKRVNNSGARKRKMKDKGDSSQARQIKRKKVTETKKDHAKERVARSWINIKLEDHQDKYKVETLASFERKNRNCDQKEEMFSCLLCGRYKSSMRNIFEEHIELHVNKALECDKCDFVTYSEVILLRHRYNLGHQDNSYKQYHRREYMCDLCGVIVSSRDGKLLHLGSVHNSPQYKCFFCDEKFLNTKRRLKHANEVHSDKVKYCKSCRQSFRTMSDDEFQQHKDSCTPSNVNQCQLCGRSFTTKCILERHIQLTHMNVRKHQCHLCPYAAKYITNLKQHLMAHNNVHPYNCDQCTFTCVQRYQLTSHMRTHSGEKPFKCTKCKFAAAWNVQLKQHLPIHDLEGTILCEKCDILFRNEKALRLHEKKEH